MNSVPILYEDKEIYVINKPAGLSVQGGQGVKHSLDEDFASQTGQKVYLVHRLDKDTAGLMVVAKSPAAASKWTKLVGGKEVRKEYVAVCASENEVSFPKKGVITEEIIQHGQKKKAVTEYEVEKNWREEAFLAAESEDEKAAFNFYKIRLKLQTGRMHQIRIHLAKSGLPIAGDDQHGNFKLNKKLKKTFKIKQLLLASVKLTLPDGRFFEIELPQHMIFAKD